MAAYDSKLERLPAQRDRFATTHWSIVVGAGGNCTTEASQALATLCENYWFPLYAFVRRTGYGPEDAQDLTQEFFLRLLADNYLGSVDRERGRFRSYLIGAMKHFLTGHDRAQTAQKRGGGQLTFSLDFTAGESRYRLAEPVDDMTPERLFERRWAMTVLDLVLHRLREEFRAAGKEQLFEGLKQFVTPGSAQQSYLGAGEMLGMTEGAAKVAAHRIRRRYRQLIKEEVARTVADPAGLEDELRELLAALGPGK